MDKISGIGKKSSITENARIRKAPPPTMERKDPGEIVMEYVCSKGDREYHSVNDSFTAVRAHEQEHISEYHEMAQKLGLKVANPHISVFSEYFPEFNRNVAVGGHAKCQFTAVIDGQEVIVPVSKDGHITDQEILKKLDLEKKRRMGLLPKKDKKKSAQAKDGKKADAPDKDKKVKESAESNRAEKSKDKDPDDYLIFGA